MKIADYICRIITGAVFIFSGIVKAIDPSGTVYKLQDYFNAFNLGFLSDLSLVFTIILCTAEFLAGFSVLFNIRFRTGIVMVILLMAVFLPLTLLIAITNPVSDCGCFGDAVKLTNWQTFIKNIILIVPALWLFFRRNSVAVAGGVARGWATLSIAGIMLIAFIFYNLRYLPVIDFLPYKTGTYIPDQMIVPEGKPADKYETTFIYEKNGERREFDLTSYPAGDTTWKFIDQKSVLVSKGYTPPIHDFTLVTPDGEDLTERILASPGYTLLMVSKKLEEADPEMLRNGYDMGAICRNNSVDFYVLTASNTEQVRNIGNFLTFLLVDETTLKTMVRANPGYLLLKEGTVLHKWSWANLPAEEEFKEIISENH
ncbi:MAG: DoxX family protein [Bacteroidales bacterium]|jgi:hypothetical protein|nr:DoxX family protein [Bacteroidales bacterium]